MKLPFKLPGIRFLMNWFRAKSRAIKAKITPEFIKETCLLAGFSMVLRGLWLIYPPAMWIIGGMALVWFGLPAPAGRVTAK